MTVTDHHLNMSGYLPNSGIVIRSNNTNLGHFTRKELASKSCSMDSMGRLWCDILDINSFLLKHPPFSIQFKKALSPFYSKGVSGIKPYKLIIDKIQLLVDMVLLNPNVSENSIIIDNCKWTNYLLFYR